MFQGRRAALRSLLGSHEQEADEDDGEGHQQRWETEVPSVLHRHGWERAQRPSAVAKARWFKAKPKPFLDAATEPWVGRSRRAVPDDETEVVPLCDLCKVVDNALDVLKVMEIHAPPCGFLSHMAELPPRPPTLVVLRKHLPHIQGGKGNWASSLCPSKQNVETNDKQRERRKRERDVPLETRGFVHQGGGEGSRCAIACPKEGAGQHLSSFRCHRSPIRASGIVLPA